MKTLENFNNLVDAFNSLPTVGKKSALRFAYHVVLKDSFNGLKLSHAIENAIKNIRKCDSCGGLSEHELCDICLDENRDTNILCIVESVKDIYTLEESGSYNGIYFVLENLDDISIAKLHEKIEKTKVNEILFALTPGLPSDAIMLFIEDRFKNMDINFTKIAQGVPTGVSLENIDALSLSKALESRTKV